MTRGSYRFVSLFLLVLVLASCRSTVKEALPTPPELVQSGTTTSTLTLKVTASSDDAEQSTDTNGVALANSRLPFGINGGVARIAGMRFRNVTIPKSATITSAVLEVRASASNTGATNFTIAGEAADNTPTYTTSTNNLGGRTKTNAKVPWQPAAWTSGTVYRSPELKTIVQGLVNRSGWQSGNALALQVTAGTNAGTRKAVSFESSSANAPKLIVTYTSTTTNPPPPTSGPCDTLSNAVVAPWQSQTLGYSSSIAGKAAQSGSSFDVCGVDAGYLATGFDEAMHYVSQPLNGNGVITVKVTSLEPGAEAGVFLKGISAYEPDDAAAGLFFKPGVAPQLESYGAFSADSVGGSQEARQGALARIAAALGSPRTPDAADLTRVLSGAVPDALDSEAEAVLSTQANALSAPQWLRIQRVNQTVTAYRSSNGTTWQEVGTLELALARNLKIGFTAASGNANQLALTHFDNVAVGALGPFVDVPAPLPYPWLRRDVGPVGTAGSSSSPNENDTFVVNGSGNGTAGADVQHLVYQALDGDGTIIAKLASLDSGAAANLQAGVMVRESLTAGSSYGFLALGLDGTAELLQAPLAPTRMGTGQVIQGRLATNKVARLLSRFKFSATATAQLNRWLMLTRQGGTLKGYVSDNNETWRQVGTAELTLDETVYLGLAVRSPGTGLASAQFQGVSVSPEVVVPVLEPDPEPTPTLPEPWQNADVGTVTTPGSASFENDTFSLTSSSSGFTQAADAFHFVHQELNGDGTLTARVVALDAATADARAGITIRETLGSGSKHALLTVGGSSPATFSSRGGDVSSSNLAGLVSNLTDQEALAPQADQLSTAQWLRLTRQGDALTGYTSSDGQTWTRMGSATVPMSAAVRVGLAVTSTSTNTSATAYFDNVVLGPVISEPSGNCEYLFDGAGSSGNSAGCEFVGSGPVNTSGGVVRTGSGSGSAFVQVYPDFLTNTASVAIAMTPRPTTFPGEFATNYPADELTTVAGAVKVTIPGSAINFADEDNFIGIYTPPNSAYNAAENNIYELHITSPQLDEPFLYFDYYSADEAAVIRTDLLKALLGGAASSDITVVIQPVSLGSTNVQSDQLSTQNLTGAEYITGLFSIAEDEAFSENFDTSCPSGIASQTIPSFASRSITLEAGKTPLVLVHGWQGLDELTTLAYEKTFFPGLCGWPAFIKNFMQPSEASLKSVGLHMLKEEYQLFIFSYDSSLSVLANADNLRMALQAFGGTQAVVLAHSMGGIVANAALNDSAPIKHLLTLGTPFRGSSAVVCIEASATQCEKAKLNYNVLIDFATDRGGENQLLRNIPTILQLRILEEQGGKDLSWEYPGYIGQPDIIRDDVTLRVCLRVNWFCEVVYRFGGKGNPKLHTLNEASDFAKHTSYFGVGIASDPTNNALAYRMFSQALEEATGHANDLIVPAESACASRQVDDNDCSSSPFKGLVKYPGLNHLDIHKERTLSAITAQLLRLAGDSYAYDIDDGTPDGNQRLMVGTISSPGVTNDTGEIDGIADYLPEDEPLIYSNTDFGFIFGNERYGEDADQNELYGDGQLGMEDFRRWRDWLLQSESSGLLNGSPQHVKKSMDGGGETVYPRWGDFNGDGHISEDDTFKVPFIPSRGDGSPTTESLTDLGVMMRVAEKNGLWDDPNYGLLDLPGLVQSGDVEVFIRDLYDLPGAASVRSYFGEFLITSVGADNQAEKQLHASNGSFFRTHTVAEPRQVYTLPAGIQHGQIEVYDSENRLILSLQKDFEVQPGSDQIWGPTAEISSDVRKTYNGPEEDCENVSGKFMLDITGLFDDGDPTIPLDQDHLQINPGSYLADVQDLGGDALINVEAEGAPSCNFEEGTADIYLTARYYDFDKGEGFLANIYDTFENIDNRWPMLVWNRTGVDPTPGCEGKTVTFELLDADPPVLVSNLGPRQHATFLARNTVTYNLRYTGENISFGESIRYPWLYEKEELYGEEAWVHEVFYQVGCETGSSEGFGGLKAQRSRLPAQKVFATEFVVSERNTP